MSIKTLNAYSLQTVANAYVFPSDPVPDAAQQRCSGLPAQHGCVQHSVCAQLMPMTHQTGRPQILHTQRHGQGQTHKPTDPTTRFESYTSLPPGLRPVKQRESNMTKSHSACA